MDSKDKLAFLRAALPFVPRVLLVAIRHQLSLSSTSKQWGLKTEVVVKSIRAFLAETSPRGALAQQTASIKGTEIKGPQWISKVTLPAPTSDCLDLLCHAIDSLKNTPNQTYTVPEIRPVEAEWTGHRAASRSAPRLRLSEQEQYKRLVQDVTNHTTILYLHGGAFIAMDPASHRVPVTRLCKMTGGKALNVRYRLAPQNPFPAALLDAFVAYLSLLYPPAGSFHEPVNARHIVLAGDSAGGNLSLVLLQLLIQINQTMKKNFQFHSREIQLPIPLPAGVAMASGWFDMTHIMPSRLVNAKYDYLPPPPLTLDKNGRPAWSAPFPDDEIWPTSPPRGDFYCDANMLCHPLVSPIAATNWREAAGRTKVWMAFGEEMLTDDGKQMASMLVEQGVAVRWEMWESMCHCFGLILVWTDWSKRFFRDWADFMKAATQDGQDSGTTTTSSSGVFFKTKKPHEQDVDVHTLRIMPHDELLTKMKTKTEKRIDLERSLIQGWAAGSSAQHELKRAVPKL